MFCLNQSTVGFQPNFFTSGYDITLTNPLHKKVNGRPLLKDTVFRECRLTADPHSCQPNIQSFVIDNLVAYHKWTRHYIKFTDTKGFNTNLDHSVIGATASATDDDLLSIQADLMSGNLIVMTHLSCPLVNTSRFQIPEIKNDYAQQLRLMVKMEEEELLELIEDFGDHYVEQAILGSEVIFRFTIDRRKVEFIKRKEVSLSTQATAAGQYIFSRSHAFINISKNNNKIALDFIATAKIQIYSGSSLSNPIPISDMETGEHWIRIALKQLTIISVRIKPIEYLFTQLSPNDTLKMQKKWWQIRQRICTRLFPLGLTDECRDTNSNNPKSFSVQAQHMNQSFYEQLSSWRSHSDVYVLPLLLIWTNQSTVCLRTSWNHWLEFSSQH